MKKPLGIAALVVLSSHLVLGYGSGTADSTHLKLLNVLFDAAAPSNLANLVLSQTAYRDLYKFRQLIRDGANSETAHHDATDTNTEYWYGNEGQWENLVRASQYPTGAFTSAYRSIGYYVHLVQDSTVPAHDRVIFHGYPALYYVAPGGGLLDASKYTTVRSDGFEFAAGDFALSDLPVVSVPIAAFHARAVMSVLQDAVSMGALAHIMDQLPVEYAPLFEPLGQDRAA